MNLGSEAHSKGPPKSRGSLCSPALLSAKARLLDVGAKWNWRLS